MSRMPLRYSQILGPVFYQIFLPPHLCDLVDTHFSASAIHYHLSKVSFGTPRVFHLIRHLAHLSAMKQIIYASGDFTEAIDRSGLGLDRREAWNPDVMNMPDPAMFDKMELDPRFGVGLAHPSDDYLNPRLLEGNHSGATEFRQGSWVFRRTGNC